jgi:hypothetical protein
MLKKLIHIHSRYPLIRIGVIAETLDSIPYEKELKNLGVFAIFQKRFLPHEIGGILKTCTRDSTIAG